jgi:DNA invertase Pin-like site-specific DNA recombinase
MLIQQRVKAGLMRARDAGTKLGRPVGSKAPIKAIEASRAQGLSIREIAEKLGTSVGTVHMALAAPT